MSTQSELFRLVDEVELKEAVVVGAFCGASYAIREACRDGPVVSPLGLYYSIHGLGEWGYRLANREDPDPSGEGARCSQADMRMRAAQYEMMRAEADLVVFMGGERLKTHQEVRALLRATRRVVQLMRGES